MKNCFQKIIASFLAVLVVVSTVSWTVDKHLCMGRVMDIAFFHSADSCGMEEVAEAFDLSQRENHCCDDESFTLQGQDDLQLSWEELDVETQQFLISFTASYYQLVTFPSSNEASELIYPPPLRAEDFNILYEVFLI